MRVLHLTGGRLYGGVERFLTELQRYHGAAPAMQPVFGLCYAGRLGRDLQTLGAEVHPLGALRASRPWQLQRARGALQQWLGEIPAAVAICHAWWPYAVFGPALRRAGTPVVLWAHDSAAQVGWLERWAGRHAPDLLIANSEYVAATLPRLFPHTAPVVFRYPVAAPQPMSAGDRIEARNQLQTGDHELAILMPSRLEPWKGHRLLLHALAQLPTGLPWRAWLGSWVQRPHEAFYLREIQALGERLGIGSRLVWLGARSDLDRLVLAADLLCQPNTRPEPYGIVFVEALAAGLPVVATRGGGASEIVTAECGELTAAEPAAVARVLEAWLGDPERRRRAASHARQRAFQLADPPTQVRQLAALLRPLAA